MISTFRSTNAHRSSCSGIRQKFVHRRLRLRAWLFPLRFFALQCFANCLAAAFRFVQAASVPVLFRDQRGPWRFVHSTIGSLAILATLSGGVIACPFCSALSNTLREDMAASDYVVLGMCERAGDTNSELPIHDFRIIRSLQGNNRWSNRSVKVLSFRSFSRQEVSLLFGVGDTEQTDWGPTQPLNEIAQEYVRELARRMQGKRQILKLELGNQPEDLTSVEDASSPTFNEDWLKFFWQHLSSTDEWVRRDAYNEFARASLDDLRSIAGIFDPQDLKKRIADSQTTVELRRLFWTLLSLTGDSHDARFAERYVFSEAKASTIGDEVGLDAALSCYLVLGGEDALQRIEAKLLSNRQADYVLRYAAIVALRVHATEFRQFGTDRLCQAFSHVLWDPNLADLVIPDLARLNDWSHIPRLVELFASAENEQKFLRVPVINYLRACPLPGAKPALEECRKIDPDAYRRANAFFRVSPHDASNQP